MELAELDDGNLSTFNEASMVSGIIGEDGVMVLKLVAANSSELLVKDVVCGISRLTRSGIMTTPVTQPLLQPTSPPGIYPAVPAEKAVP